jgi:acetyl-CoA synthetase
VLKMTTNTAKQQLMEIAARIREMREIMGWSIAEMAVKTEVSEEQYVAYETAEADIPFSFIHKCALEFGVELTEFLEGHNAARLSSYTVTRKGQGLQTAVLEEFPGVCSYVEFLRNSIPRPSTVPFPWHDSGYPFPSPFTTAFLIT